MAVFFALKTPNDVFLVLLGRMKIATSADRKNFPIIKIGENLQQI